jgi:hypothetical protein
MYNGSTHIAKVHHVRHPSMIEGDRIVTPDDN